MQTVKVLQHIAVGTSGFYHSTYKIALELCCCFKSVFFLRDRRVSEDKWKMFQRAFVKDHNKEHLNHYSKLCLFVCVLHWFCIFPFVYFYHSCMDFESTFLLQ